MAIAKQLAKVHRDWDTDAAQEVLFQLIDTSPGTEGDPLTGASVTCNLKYVDYENGSAPDYLVSSDESAYINEIGNGWYYFDGQTASHFVAPEVILSITATNARDVDIEVQCGPPLDWLMLIDDLNRALPGETVSLDPGRNYQANLDISGADTGHTNEIPAIWKSLTLEGNGATLTPNSNNKNSPTPGTSAWLNGSANHALAVESKRTLVAEFTGGEPARSESVITTNVDLQSDFAPSDPNRPWVYVELGEAPGDSNEPAFSGLYRVRAVDATTITIDHLIPYDLNTGSRTNKIYKIDEPAVNVIVRNLNLGWANDKTQGYNIGMRFCGNVLFENCSGVSNWMFNPLRCHNIAIINADHHGVSQGSGQDGRILDGGQTQNLFAANLRNWANKDIARPINPEQQDRNWYVLNTLLSQASATDNENGCIMAGPDAWNENVIVQSVEVRHPWHQQINGNENYNTDTGGHEVRLRDLVVSGGALANDRELWVEIEDPEAFEGHAYICGQRMRRGAPFVFRATLVPNATTVYELGKFVFLANIRTYFSDNTGLDKDDIYLKVAGAESAVKRSARNTVQAATWQTLWWRSDYDFRPWTTSGDTASEQSKIISRFNDGTIASPDDTPMTKYLEVTTTGTTAGAYMLVWVDPVYQGWGSRPPANYTDEGNAVGDIKNLLEADIEVDTAQTPWEVVWQVKGTSTELMRKRVRDVNGVDITDATTVVGKLIQ